jgi:pimeloyl-ACP methyl ester carboxylesterase
MTSYVTSADGTRIAYDRLGEGPTLVVANGIFCTRQTTQQLAEALAQRFSVVNYDRRGRGDSGETPPYTAAREVEDLAALIAVAGGSASVYGHSSGAGLALHAAAGGLPITRLVLHEPPYGPDDEESTRSARTLAENVRVALAEDRRADAIALFFADMGLPEEVAAGMCGDPAMQAVAPTMIHDFEIMGDFGGGTIPEDLVRAVAVPTLVIAGGASPDFFRDTATRLAELLPDGTLTVLEGHDHGAPADVVAPVVGDFLSTSPLEAHERSSP